MNGSSGKGRPCCRRRAASLVCGLGAILFAAVVQAQDVPVPEVLPPAEPAAVAVPPEATRDRPDSTHGGNPEVRARKGMPEHVAWAYERPDGGRGFGFTGAHFHKNWANESFRKIVLNALLWTAKAEVPANGVECSVTAEDLQKNLDSKRR